MESCTFRGISVGTPSKINTNYINNGDITSGATFPPNPIEGKTLRIKIVEDKVGEMRIDDRGSSQQNYIERAA